MTLPQPAGTRLLPRSPYGLRPRGREQAGDCQLLRFAACFTRPDGTSARVLRGSGPVETTHPHERPGVAITRNRPILVARTPVRQPAVSLLHDSVTAGCPCAAVSGRRRGIVPRPLAQGLTAGARQGVAALHSIASSFWP